MAKLVSYSVAERRNLQKPTEPAKFYAQAQSSGRADLDDMCDRIEEKCTLHSADVLCVMRALEKEVTEALERGEIVELGRIGTLQIGLESAGCDTREKFKAHYIESAHVVYRPSKVFEKMLIGVEYRKVSRKGYNDIVDLVEDTPTPPPPAGGGEEGGEEEESGIDPRTE